MEDKMYRNLFTAWYCLGALVLCATAYLIALPYVGADWARNGFGILGAVLLGLLPLLRFAFFRKEPDDERDTSFLQRSLAVGFYSFVYAILVVTSCLTLFCKFVLGVDSVSLSVFWIPAIAGSAIGTFVFSVLLLLFYYKGEHADRENELEL